jgi:hypothetical protein
MLDSSIESVWVLIRFTVNKTAAINSTCSGVSITVTKVSLGQLSCHVTEIAWQSSLFAYNVNIQHILDAI